MSNLSITPQVVKYVIEKHLKLAQLPLNESLREFALSDNDLLKLQSHVSAVLGKDVALTHSDTIYEITDKFLAV